MEMPTLILYDMLEIEYISEYSGKVLNLYGLVRLAKRV